MTDADTRPLSERVRDLAVHCDAVASRAEKSFAHQAAVRVSRDAQTLYRAAERIKKLEAFLRRIREWDQMNPPMTGDHAAVAATIDALLNGPDQ